jgi:RNA polymerase subunit RPABC4/transcription elongation factor Spt4
MRDRTFNLTPDPKVLIALTRTPLKPLDALCELIDNALDGFRIAEGQGTPVAQPYITIDLPGVAEIDRGSGILRIRDNGPGMSAAVAEKALSAGYSSNNPFDSLGLFGMGFNISTGKLGRKTVFRTVRAVDDQMLAVTIDLEAIQRAKSYDVPVSTVPRSDDFAHGTIVEVSDWWPKGDANQNFAKSLAGMRARLPVLIGRRYATLLRDRNVRIMVNREPCEPFEHCVWSAHRSVERQGHGHIPARIDFDHSVGSQRRCSACYTLIEGDATTCPACGSGSFRSLNQRIRGWVGIQRYDDQTDFGIDLIRNGRAIRTAEKSAFFEYADELGVLTKDYPIDQQYGRIVGEVHLDHVPVDFQKQDFQRSTPEWTDAVRYLRGASSLQPNKPGADQNDSPVFRLYQGYRKVRNVGRRDMYMGQWDAGAERPRRVSRELEQDLYARFRRKESGYYDDSEWWKFVDAAEHRPMEELTACPECGAENIKSAEECSGCGYALIGHECPTCGKRILASAHSCPHCGQSQLPDDTSPWHCGVCDNDNPWDQDACGHCTYPRGTPPLASPEFLRDRSVPDIGLSISGCTLALADGSWSQPLNIKVYRSAEHIHPQWEGPPVPLVTVRAEELAIFVDPRHEVFTSFDVKMEALIASEIAHFVYMQNQRLAATSRGQHSVAALTSAVITRYYRAELDLSAEGLREAITGTMTAIRRRLAQNLRVGEGEDLYSELSDAHQEAFARNLLASGRSLTDAPTVVASGEFIDLVEPAALVRLFEMRPDLLAEALATSSHDGAVGVAIAESVARQLARDIARGLEDCADYLVVVNPSEPLSKKAKAALEYVRSKLEL